MNSRGVVNDEAKIDDDSKRGRFGWWDIEGKYIPYVFRTAKDTKEKTRYVPLRIAQSYLFNQFLQILPPDVSGLAKDQYKEELPTQLEIRLLNEINVMHCNCHFGKQLFSEKDKIVSLEDAKEFFEFLKFCHLRLILRQNSGMDDVPQMRCGFIRINGESIIPYIVLSSKKYMPLFYFEEIADHINYAKHEIKSWDWAYLKLCCRIQGIKKELFATETCDIIAFQDVSKNFPPDTKFENFWHTPQGATTAPPNQQKHKEEENSSNRSDYYKKAKIQEEKSKSTSSNNSTKQQQQQNHLTRQTRRTREEYGRRR